MVCVSGKRRQVKRSRRCGVEGWDGLRGPLLCENFPQLKRSVIEEKGSVSDGFNHFVLDYMRVTTAVEPHCEVEGTHPALLL